jgi:putative hydrolase of the HAD superfamily
VRELHPPQRAASSFHSVRHQNVVLLFDIDDTLIEHTVALETAALSLHSYTALAEPPHHFLAHWKQVHAEMFPRYLRGELEYKAMSRERIRKTVDPNAQDDAADELFHLYLDAYQNAWAVCPDVFACLDRLQSFRIGAISNGRSVEQKRKLAVVGLIDKFERVVISEDVGFPKPDKRIFLYACEQMRVPPSQATYVGDNYEIDACGARDAGLAGVWLNRKGIPAQHYSPPFVNSLNEFADLLHKAPKIQQRHDA